MKISRLLLLPTLVLSLWVTGCKTNDTPEPEPQVVPDELTVSITTADFQAAGGNTSALVKTNVTTWTAEADQSWCTTKVNGNALIITAAESEERSVRECTVTVKAKALSKTIAVRQLGYEGAVLLSENNFEVDPKGGPINFVVTTNVTLVPEVSHSWVYVPETKAVPMTETSYYYQVTANRDADPRAATITFTEATPAGAGSDFTPLKAVVNITQGINQGYLPMPGDSLEDDIKLTVANATATSSQQGTGIGLAFDGDYSTHWHSVWENEAPDYWPITATFELSQVESVDYLVYHPRNDGSNNGNFKEVTIEYSEDGSNYTKLMDFDFQGNGAATQVMFDAPARAKYFRFVIRSGAGSRAGFAACSEMEFYKKNPNTFDYTTLFADEICSRLKDGVTQAQIDACQHPFYKNLANYMFTNRYPTEFRVNEFKAYPNPNVQAKTHCVYPHSRLDNPTGISVKQGDELIVLVGKTHNRPVSLMIQNLDRPDNNGTFWGSTHPLTQGVNKIQVKNNGLCYVLYHTSTVEEADAAQPIPMHFTSGEVNGYYDNENPAHKGRWSDLLAKSKDKYFDVLGKHTHITYEVEDFRKYALTTGPELIEAYDKIVGAQRELLGLEYFNKPLRNRMYFSVMYHNFAYTTDYYISINKNQMNNACDAEKLLAESWTVAHEAGHLNQMYKHFMWVGTSEVTNNLFSLYVQTQVSGKEARISVPQFGTDWRNSYSRGFTQIIAQKNPFVIGGDVFARVVPFWQLELYFGQVKGDSPSLRADKGGFYPEVFEYMRNTPAYAGMSSTDCQLEFVYAACKAAKTNLLDFFERWGFLTPVDELISDYWSERMEVTPAKVAALRARVEALGYPEPTQPIHYISDNNVQMYKDNARIVESYNPTHAFYIEDNTTEYDESIGQWVSHTCVAFHFKEFKNIVAYEVEDENGNFIFACNGNIDPRHDPDDVTPGHDFFKIPGKKWKDGMKVFAIGATGERLEIPVIYQSTW